MRSPGLDSRSLQGSAAGLYALFAAAYFAQGLGSPTDGLLTLPVLALLKSSGLEAAQIATFSAIASSPWAMKPVLGLLTDSVELLGQRRKSWLFLASGGAAASFLALYALSTVGASLGALLILLAIATLGVAFGDVVVDALMVEKGRPRGITGRLQSVQWASLYGASMLAAVGGGWLAQLGAEQLGFLISAAVAGVACLIALTVTEEPAHSAAARPEEQPGFRALVRAFASPPLPAVTGFLVLHR